MQLIHLHRAVRALSLTCLIPWGIAAACSNQPKPVALGGVDGFSSLANPANTSVLRASCKVSLYIHDYIWTRLKGGDPERRAILHTFAGTGPAMVELGATDNAHAYFGTYYPTHYLRVGVKADTADVNGANAVTLPQWQAYVAAGRADGLQTIAPVFAPNDAKRWHNGHYNAETWSKIKRRALIGGGLSVDAPPAFFFANTPAYRLYIAHEIQWANQHKLISWLIISPNTAGPRFLSDTQAMIAWLTRHHALPTRYIAENYQPLPYPKHLLNLVGTETDPKSIAGVALWLTTLFPNPRPSINP